MAAAAVAAGWRVTVYARLEGDLPRVEERDGYRLVRVPADWRQAIPLLPPLARLLPPLARRRVSATATPALTDGERLEVESDEAPSPARLRLPRRGSGPISRTLVPQRARRLVPEPLRRWRRNLLSFPLRPLGWAKALDEVVTPADVWHGMWAGSLPAVLRQRRRLGGGAIYDSRDVYMQSRDWARLEWPLKPIVSGLERRWARRVDRVLTVNEDYARLLVEQLGVKPPIVVMNCPPAWTPPEPPPDRIRHALGLDPEVPVVLYAGQLISDRGIEQTMDAILLMQAAVLVLLGFGPWEPQLRLAARRPPYSGRVHILPAVAPDALLPWTASADVAVMAIQPTSVNHTFTTPQKLFESIAAGVPVVASDLPGMRRVVEAVGAGALCDPTSPQSIAAAIESVLAVPAAERRHRRDRILAVAHERYSGEAQAAILLGVYRQLVSERVRERGGAG